MRGKLHAWCASAKARGRARGRASGRRVWLLSLLLLLLLMLLLLILVVLHGDLFEQMVSFLLRHGLQLLLRGFLEP